MSLLTGFEGRINRARWWLGLVIVILIAIVVFNIMRLFIESENTRQLLVMLVLAYPMTALMMKRLKDRDRPGYLGLIFWVAGLLSVFGVFTGTIATVAEIGIGLWWLIELGVLRGTDGPNQHGSDPLME